MHYTEEEMKKRCSNFNWCIENDFQVYAYPDKMIPDTRGGLKGSKEHRIHIRRGGITTEGKDFIIKDGLQVESKLTIGDKVYKTQAEATDAVYVVCGKLRERYG